MFLTEFKHRITMALSSHPVEPLQHQAQSISAPIKALLFQHSPRPRKKFAYTPSPERQTVLTMNKPVAEYEEEEEEREKEENSSEAQLRHKPSFFDLARRSDTEDSDSTASIFSDSEDTPSLRPMHSASSLLSNASNTSVDSYFESSNDLPIKSSTQHRLQSLSNAPAIIKRKSPHLSFTRQKPSLRSINTTASISTSPTLTVSSNWNDDSLTPTLPKVRRTHSMFQNAKDVLNEEADDIPSSPSGVFEDQEPILARKDCPIKSFTIDQDPLRRITRETLCEILDGKHSDLYDRHMVIDCRFEYEYAGGHIDGAININTRDHLEETLISNISSNPEKTLLIFHCEYSAHRGPLMAMHLRQLDREVNMNRYPILNYPDIAILDGGYSHFFKMYNSRCFPPKYVAMKDDETACEREMDRFRRTMKAGRSKTMPAISSGGSALRYKFQAPKSPVAARSKSMLVFPSVACNHGNISCDSSSEEEEEEIEFNFSTVQKTVLRRRLLGPAPSIPKFSLSKK